MNRDLSKQLTELYGARFSPAELKLFAREIEFCLDAQLLRSHGLRGDF